VRNGLKSPTTLADEILNALEAMLQSAIFEFENRSAVYQALQRAQGTWRFSDYLIGAIAHQVGCKETATFDRKLQGEKWFNYPHNGVSASLPAPQSR